MAPAAASVSLAPLLVAAILVNVLTLEAPQAVAARALTAAPMALEEVNVPRTELDLLPLQSSHRPTSEAAVLSSEEGKKLAVDGLAMGIRREPDSQLEWACCSQYESSSSESVSSDLQTPPLSWNSTDYLMPEPDYPTEPLGPTTGPRPAPPPGQLPFLPALPPPARN